MVTPGNTNETADSPESGEEVDWKTKYEEQQAENQRLAKEAEDARASQIGRLRQGARDELLTNLHTNYQGIDQRLAGFERGMEILLDAVGGGDYESARQQFAQVRQETNQQLQNSNWETYYQVKGNELLELTKDEQGNDLLDLNNDPALETVRTQWLGARDRQDRAGIEAAISQAKDVAYQRRLELLKAPPPGGEPQSGESPSETQEPEGDLFGTMDTGATSGGVGTFGSRDSVIAAYLGGRIDTAKYEQELRRFPVPGVEI